MQEDNLMSVFMLLFILAILGAGTWLLITYVPMPQGIRTVIIVVAIIVAALYALHAFGLRVPNIQVPQVR
jgi:hypothetical protein